MVKRFYIPLIVLVAFALSGTNPVFAGVEPAERDSHSTPSPQATLPSPGILPSSPVLYWFKSEGEYIRLFFDRNPNDRLSYLTYLSMLRLAEASALAGNLDVVRIPPTLQRYAATLQDIQRIATEQSARLDPLIVQKSLAQSLEMTDVVFSSVISILPPADREAAMNLQDRSDQTTQTVLEQAHRHGNYLGGNDAPGTYPPDMHARQAFGTEVIPPNPALTTADRPTKRENIAAGQLDNITVLSSMPKK
jgi:hypothetical protein